MARLTRLRHSLERKSNLNATRNSKNSRGERKQQTTLLLYTTPTVAMQGLLGTTKTDVHTPYPRPLLKFALQ